MNYVIVVSQDLPLDFELPCDTTDNLHVMMQWVHCEIFVCTSDTQIFTFTTRPPISVTSEK